MKKFVEKITALDTGDGIGALQISRKERLLSSDERLKMILKYIVFLSVLAAIVLIVLFADFKNLAVISLAGIIIFFIYLGLKD